MKLIRWQLFKLISRFGWWICPEPHKTNLQRGLRFDFKPDGPNEKVRNLWEAYRQALKGGE